MLRIPTGGRQTSWLYTSVDEKLNSGLPRTTSASGQNGICTLLVDSLNYAYFYGELSNTQKQAVNNIDREEGQRQEVDQKLETNISPEPGSQNWVKSDRKKNCRGTAIYHSL